MRRVDGLLLEGGEILLADYLVRHGVEFLQRRNGGSVDARALALAARLKAFAGRETVAVVVSGERETAKPAGGVVVEGSWPAEMTAQAAGDLIGISVQATRRMCRDGKLLARLDHAGRWAIDGNAAAAEAARRKGRP